MHLSHRPPRHSAQVLFCSPSKLANSSPHLAYCAPLRLPAPTMQWRTALTSLAALALALSQPATGAVIGIDLGGEYFKIALVKPGKSLEIVLNVESKRKTATMVGYHDGEQLFSTSATNMVRLSWVLRGSLPRDSGTPLRAAAPPPAARRRPRRLLLRAAPGLGRRTRRRSRRSRRRRSTR